MNQLTPSSVREAVIKSAQGRLSKLEAVARAPDHWDADLRLATTILVAEILRDVEILVIDSLFSIRKQKLHRMLSRVTVSKNHNQIAPVLAAFASEARRILPTTVTFDPENPPF